MKCIAEHQPE